MASPYEAPRARLDPRPPIITWFRAYALVSGIAYIGAVVWIMDTSTRAAPIAIGALAFALLHLVAAAVPFKPWGWTLAFVTLGFGIASAGFLFALPLAIGWNRPLVRAAFGRPP